MSDFLKKPYEISLWDDVLVFEVEFYNGADALVETKTFEKSLPDFSIINPNHYKTAIKQYYKEVKLCTIGSDTMSTPIRAFMPKLQKNINGSSELSFSIFYRYHDDDEGEFFDNPFVPFLVNERKVKLRYGQLGDPDCKWYDFIIKNIVENSENYMFSYIAKDIFINELSKSGFNLEFDAKLENNQGTLDELAERVLEGSDWKFKSNSDLKLKETKNEPLYRMTLNQPIVATYMEDVEKNGEVIHKAGETFSIPAREEIYGFYTPINNENPYFQFLYVADGAYEWNEEWTITNSPNYYIKDVVYEKGEPTFIVPGSMTVSGTYRGERLVRKATTKYDPKMDKYVSVYTGDVDGVVKEIYGFIENDYISSASVNSYVTNANDFESQTGWNEGAAKSGGTVSYPQIELKTLPDIFSPSYVPEYTDFVSYLVVNYSDVKQSFYNTGISDYRTSINSFAKGEKYVCRIKCGELSGARVVPTTAKLVAKVQKYSIDEQGVFVPSADYFTFDLKPDSDTGYVMDTSVCSIALSFTDMLKDKYCLSIYSNTTGKDLYFEDVQFFPYVPKNEEDGDTRENMVMPGDQITARVEKTYYYYDPKQDYKDADDVKYLYKGSKPNPNYQSSYNDSEKLKFTKVRSITASESNRFNLIQSLCETFECWADFEIAHNLQTGEIEIVEEYNSVDIDKFDLHQRYYTLSGDSYVLVPSTAIFNKETKYYVKNYRQKKWVSFYTQVNRQNFVGFRYGTNLKNIQRNLESDGIVSKIVVKNNSNQHAKDGFCTIARADENPTGENFIYDFSYYVGQKLMNFTEINNDLYMETTGYLGYYKKLKKINRKRDVLIEELSHLVTEQSTYESNYQTYSISVDKSKELKEDKEIQVRITTGFTSDQIIAAKEGDGKVYDWSLDPDVRALCVSIKKLDGTIIRHTALRDAAKKNLDFTLERKKAIDGEDGELKKLVKAKLSLEVQFYKKYSRFIQEGSWISEDYVDDTLYYLDAESTLHTSAQPKVNYTINVLEISQIEGYENYTFDLGDRTFVEDTEFFGWHYDETGEYVPTREEVVISQIILNLDSPEQNTIKVQNYKTQFEDLFQRITATTQAVEYSQGRVQQVTNVVKPNGTISFDAIQNSIFNNSLIIENAKDQSVIWDETGITTTSLTSPNEVLRIVSGGVFISTDGGITWNTGMTGKGINASYITSGQIDTSLIRIMNGSFASFRWDPFGLSAYEFEMDKAGVSAINFNYSKFIRFDQYGIYGIRGVPNFNPTIGEQDESGETIVGEKKIQKYSDFSLTWNGFQIKSNHEGEGEKGYISITSKDDFRVVNNEGVTQVKIGYLRRSAQDHIYGIQINDAKGAVVMESDNQGQLWLRNRLHIGDSKSTVGIGYLEGLKPSTSNVHEVINANDKFKVYEDGSMTATDGIFTGTIYAKDGTIGDLTIGQVEGAIKDVRGIEIQSQTGFTFKVDGDGNPTPDSITLNIISTGVNIDSDQDITWYGSPNFEGWEIIAHSGLSYVFNYSDYKDKFLGGNYFIRAKFTTDQTYEDYCTINTISDGTSPIEVVVENNSGNFFINGDIDATLVAKVFRGNEEITDSFTPDQFSWTKYDENGEIDQEWTSTHQNYGNQVKITHINVDRKARFLCNLSL